MNCIQCGAEMGTAGCTNFACPTRVTIHKVSQAYAPPHSPPDYYYELQATRAEVDRLAAEMAEARKEVERLNAWVADLQTGTYVNCVYCGHRYPPGTPEVRDKVLYEHIKVCPKHPAAKINQERDELRKEVERLRGLNEGAVKAAVDNANRRKKAEVERDAALAEVERQAGFAENFKNQLAEANEEVERLKLEAAQAKEDCRIACVGRAAFLVERDAALACLREVEWGNKSILEEDEYGRKDPGICPGCDAFETEGHRKGCKIAALLSGTPGEAKEHPAMAVLRKLVKIADDTPAGTDPLDTLTVLGDLTDEAKALLAGKA